MYSASDPASSVQGKILRNTTCTQCQYSEDMILTKLLCKKPYT